MLRGNSTNRHRPSAHLKSRSVVWLGSRPSRAPRALATNGHLRRGGIRRKLITLLVVAVVLVALLPMIIAKTPLRNVIISAVVPSDAIRVSVGGASLGWLSGPSLAAVQVNDSAGNELISADSITVDRAPVNLLLNSRDLGVIQINRPTIKLKVRPDGSNLEDALQKLLADISSPAGPVAQPADAAAAAPAFAVQVVDGVILAEDVATGRVWRIEAVNVQYDCHGAAGRLGNGSLSGQITVVNPAQPPCPPVNLPSCSSRTVRGTSLRSKPTASPSPSLNRGYTASRM